MLTLKQILFGLVLSFITLIGVALMLLPALGVVSGYLGFASAALGIVLTIAAILLEHDYYGTAFYLTIKPPCIVGIIIITTLITYSVLVLLL